MKKILMESVSEEGDQLYIDFSQLSIEEGKNPEEFMNYLIKILDSIYNDQSVKSKTRLRIVK